ncbi:MAG TPA: EscU/YscU/HrcU family type III secretion system export apparatus switch protein, partial [Candidatus Cybelea sp.]|nr:EscU/YscU/HrcU family type III secretion system export apparatus switch protein [Candidatus Cybelea sp.]
SPTEGFKKLFSLKNLMELIKSFIKAVVVTLVLWSVLRHDVGMLLKSSACGIGCIQPVLGRVLFPIVTSVAALFLLSGLLDIGLQRFLFARDMKMSHTEMKRERKEEDGDPVIKRAMHRVRHEVMHGPKVGVKQANMMFVDGSRIAVGMRFVRGETPAPLVVCKGRDDQAIALVQAARRQGAAVLDNAELARALGERVPIGRYIPKDLFPAVAKEMTQAKIV